MGIVKRLGFPFPDIDLVEEVFDAVCDRCGIKQQAPQPFPHVMLRCEAVDRLRLARWRIGDGICLCPDCARKAEAERG